MFKILFNSIWFRVALYFSVIATVFIGVMFQVIISQAGDLREARSFYQSGINIQRDLEQQLISYREKYIDQIRMLFTVRPTLSEVIHFLETVEEINSKVRLKTNIKSLEKNPLTDLPEASPYLKYQIEFSSTIKKSSDYIQALMEDLPFYVKISNLYIRQDLENLPPELYRVVIILELYINNDDR